MFFEKFNERFFGHFNYKNSHLVRYKIYKIYKITHAMFTNMAPPSSNSKKILGKNHHILSATWLLTENQIKYD